MIKGDYTGNEEFESQFRIDTSEYIEKLKTGNEMERLWAVAKIEEKCHNHGIPKFIVDCLLRLIENDESEIVRAFSIKALYHQSTESWPYKPEDRKKIFEAINNHLERLNNNTKYGIDHFITYEILEIESRLKWLSNPQHFWLQR